MIFTFNNPTIKVAGTVCFIMMFKATDSFDGSMETMKKLLAHEDMKVRSNAVLALAALVDKFGPEKVKTADYDEIMLENAKNACQNPPLKSFSY